MKRIHFLVVVLVLLVNSFSAAAQSNAVRNALRGVAYVLMKESNTIKESFSQYKQSYNQYDQVYRYKPYSYSYPGFTGYSGVQNSFYGSWSQPLLQLDYSSLGINSSSLYKLNISAPGSKRAPSVLTAYPVTLPQLNLDKTRETPVSFSSKPKLQEQPLQFLDFNSSKHNSMSTKELFEKPDTVFHPKSIEEILSGGEHHL